MKLNIRFDPICARAEFRKNAGVRDIRVMDMMVIKVRLLKIIICEQKSIIYLSGSTRLEGGRGTLEAEQSYHGKVVQRGLY